MGICDRQFRLVGRHRARGHFISAMLLLLHQKWRTSINRFTEAMTLFAVSCAGLFPLLHLGRPWVFFWLLPYPDTMRLWPQFRSPFVWDVFAVSTYFTVSLIFWYIGIIPDLATIRDRATDPRAKLVYGIPCVRLARVRRPLATASIRVSASRRRCYAARAFGPQRCQPRFCGGALCRGGTRPSFPPTLSLGPSIPVSPWC